VRRALRVSVIGAVGVGLLCSVASRPAEALPPQAAASPPKAAAAPPVPFETIAANAARAREADALDEAVRWYRRGVRMRPTWDEGWWYLATLLYDRDRYAEARDAFAGFLKQRPDPGPAWALRGLCEFQLKEYEAAALHLGQWLDSGSPGNIDTSRVAWYHLSVLRIRKGQFELAIEPMTQACRSGPETPQLVRAGGLLLLRMAVLPADVPGDKTEMVDVAGRAAYSWLAAKADEAEARFQDLLRRFPEAPNAHYCYGLFLMQMGPDPEAAFGQFREAMRLQPEDVYPPLEMAFQLIKRGEYAAARPYAEAAVKLAPRLFASHNALGRALVEAGELERGIAELEEAARLAPESPEMFFALAQAYQKAGRADDAEKARETFRTLDEHRNARKATGLAAAGHP
jgi:tetratricopeptide (TPR) repeat protein